MSNIQGSPIARGALRVGARVKESARLFRRGIKASVGVGKDTYVRTAEKIKRKDTKIAAENKKQDRMASQTREKVGRANREASIESRSGKSFIRPVGNIIKRAVTTPLKALMNLIGAWAIVNLPKIIKAVQIFIKRLKVLKGVLKKTFSSVKSLFGSLKNIAGAWIQNMIEFDFEDSKGRLEQATQELEDNMDEIRIGVEEFQNVWSREEEELDKILERLDSEESLSEIIKVVEGQQTLIGPDATPQTTSSGNGSGSPMNATDQQAFKYVYDLAKKHGAKYPEVAAAQAMQETGYLRNPNSVYFNTGKTNAFGQTVEPAREAGSFKRRGIVDTIFYADRYWAVYDSFESGVKDHVNLWHKSRSGMKNYNDYDTAAEGIANILKKYSPDKDPENIRRGFSVNDYIGGVLDMIRGAGIDPTGSAGQELSPKYAEAKAPQTTAPPSQAPQPAAPSGSGTIKAQGNTTSKASGVRKGDKISGFTVTSAYGPRWGSTHKGIDIGTPTGTYIAFSVPVEIMAAGWYGGYGYLVDAWAPSLGVQMRVAHLSELKVKKGQMVAAGVPVGRAGSTGRSTGPHVHFEVDRQKNGIRYGGSASVADLAQFIKYLILSSSAPKKSNKQLTANAKSKAPNTTLTAASSNRTNLPQGSKQVTVVTQKEYITVA